MLPTRWKKTHFEVSPEMSEYIKQSTNKSLETYKKNKFVNGLYVLNKEEKNIFVLAFVSIFFFFMGYKFKQLTN